MRVRTGTNRLFNENCLSSMVRMPSNFVDLVVTSPPYDSLKKYNGYSFDFQAVAAELYRVIKPGGVVVWIVGDATKKGNESGSSFKQALHFQKVGFNLHDTMIWHKSNAFNFGSNECYRQAFEYMFVFSKGKPKTIRLIKDMPTVMAGQTVRGARKHTDGSRDQLASFKVPSKKKRDNVWSISTTSGNTSGHPATFPLQLALDHIRTWSKQGDLVYDPFIGSGTTAVAAKRLKRKWLGSEISTEYADFARSRISLEKN